MNINDIQIKFCKYRITKFEIVIPTYSEPYVIDDAHVGNFVIEKDFENYTFPYLEFRVIVPNKVYMDMCQNSDDIFIDLKLEYAQFEDMYEMSPDAASQMYGTIFDNRFYAFLSNNTPRITDSSTGEKEDASLSQDELTQYSFSNDKEVTLLLYRADHIFPCNTIVNNVLSKATISDAIAYYMGQLGMKNVLMSPAQNGQIYDQLVLPPIPAVKGMQRLLKTYGLHKAGSILFFDYDTIYIIDKKLGATAWINNEIKTVYLTSYPGLGDSQTMKSGFYANGQEKYCVCNIIGNSLSIENQSMLADQLVGSNALLINSQTGEIRQVTSKVSVSKQSMSTKGQINRIMVQDRGSDTGDAEKMAMDQSRHLLNMLFQDINIRALAPNKDFIFSTDNTKYQKYMGHYRVLKESFTFTKESSLYTVMASATFKGGDVNLS